MREASASARFDSGTPNADSLHLPPAIAPWRLARQGVELERRSESTRVDESHYPFPARGLPSAAIGPQEISACGLLKIRGRRC